MANTTWKKVVYDCADAYRTATSTTVKVKVNELAGKISKLKTVTVDRISVTSPPLQTAYASGDTLSLEGICITAEYSNGAIKDITALCSFSPGNGDALRESDEKINIVWVDEAGTRHETTQSIKVSLVLVGISITVNPTKTKYEKGDRLNLSGIKVVATYEGGMTRDVTSQCGFSPATNSLLNTYGDITITASYALNGKTKTATTKVSVSVKIVSWSGGTDAQIVEMVRAADDGQIILSDYWHVGDERTISLSAMDPSGYIPENHVAQNIKMVLMNVGGKTLSSGKECSFIVGQKNGLVEPGILAHANPPYGWLGGSADGMTFKNNRREWLNQTYYNAIPSSIRPIFKQFKYKCAFTASFGPSGPIAALNEGIDYFTYSSEEETFGSSAYTFLGGEGAQFDYYKSAANRIKCYGEGGETFFWCLRSLNQDGSTYLGVGMDGDNNNYRMQNDDPVLIAPFGCI